ncbi:MAG: ParA family protein [Acidobacteria bacterium]|nr:ParA family protein [Acidobacteriota bacterium]
MKAVISVVNVAAGVGKTTISVNLAVELSARGHQTLLIDADPQANATRFFMKTDQIGWTLADTLCPPDPGARHNFARWDMFSPSRFANLYVVPSAIRLATFEGMEASHVTDLKSRLATIEHSYEFIVIDTPSSLALLTQACLNASTHVLAPISPGGQGEAGWRLLFEYIGDMPCVLRPALLGLMCNRFNCRSHESGACYEALKEEWGGWLCETIIHRDDLIEGCGEQGLPIQVCAPNSPAASLYSDLADELIVRLSMPKAQGEIPTSANHYAA